MLNVFRFAATHRFATIGIGGGRGQWFGGTMESVEHEPI